MIVGVPKEIKDNEYRAGLVPTSVLELTHHNHEVLARKLRIVNPFGGYFHSIVSVQLLAKQCLGFHLFLLDDHFLYIGIELNRVRQHLLIVATDLSIEKVIQFLVRLVLILFFYLSFFVLLGNFLSSLGGFPFLFFLSAFFLSYHFVDSVHGRKEEGQVSTLS